MLCGSFAKNQDKNMFGDLMGMMGKLKETQKKVEETKKRLDTVTLVQKNLDESISVQISANKQIIDLQISEDMKSSSSLESELKEVLNQALQEAGKIQEAELAAVAKDGLPNIPGLDKMFR